MADVNIRIRVVNEQATAALRKLENQSKRTERSIRSLSDGLNRSLNSIRQSFRGVEANIQRFAANFAANLASQAVFTAINTVRNGIRSAIDSVIEFETALIGVGKTTDIEGQALEDFGDQIDELSKQIPVSSKELLNLAQVAGQLGVTGERNLLKFTETVAKLQVSTDLVGTEGATALARILNVTGEAASEIDTLGSVIVALGNQFAASESQIISVTSEVARATARFGISSAQATALGAALRSLGGQAEGSGTAVGRAFREIERAIDEGGERLQAFANITGLTVDELKTQFGEDAIGVFNQFIQGLGRVEESGGSVGQTLRLLGLDTDRIAKVLPLLAERSDEVARAFRIAGGEVENATALNREAEKAFSTLASQLQIAANNIEIFARNIAGNLSPALKAIAQTVADTVGQFSEFTNSLDNAEEVGQTFINVLSGIVRVGTIAVNTFRSLQIGINLLFAGIATLAAAVIRPITTIGRGLISLTQAIGRFSGVDTSGLDEFKQDLLDLERLALSASGTFVDEAGNIADAIGRTDSFADQFTNNLQANFDKQIAAAKNAATEIDSTNQQRTNSTKAATQEQIASGEEQTAATEQQTEAQIQAFRKRKDERIKARQEELAAEDALFLAEQEAQAARDGIIDENEQLKLLRLADQRATAREQELLAQQKELLSTQQFELLKTKILTDQLKRRTEIATKQRSTELRDQQTFFSAARSLSSSENKVLLGISKAAALAQIAIKTPEAIASSFAFGARIGGPPLGFTFGAIAAAAQAAQAAQVAGLSFQDGGIVPGTSFAGDRVPARVNSGEMILNRQQQAELFNIANGQNEGGGRVVQVNTTVELDGEVLGRSISRQVADGLELGEVV